tara:strand:- start:135 stop:416 length:282 start_codon:yes stop_codon:yes gene_type:complete
MEIFVTLRGNFKSPPIVKVDIINDKIISINDINIETNNITADKRGTNGIEINGDLLYVALWDRIIILNKSDLTLKDVFHVWFYFYIFFLKPSI